MLSKRVRLAFFKNSTKTFTKQVLAFEKSWQSLYVFLHNASAGSRPHPPSPGKGRECPENRTLYDIASIYGNGLGLVEVCDVLGGLGVFWGGLGRFNVPHDGALNHVKQVQK